MVINICVPTLNRYDLLYKLIESVENEPNFGIAFIIDNGNKLDIPHFTDRFKYKVHIMQYGENIGVAKSWNWFINYVPEFRIICNDDVEFTPGSLQKLVDGHKPDFISYPSGFSTTNMFSCFVLNDDVVSKVGYFDEDISPNYAYFEDNDYSHRLSLAGLGSNAIADCFVHHQHSSTLKAFSIAESRQHHEKFKLAKENYIRKWGGEPGKEQFSTPYNR